MNMPAGSGLLARCRFVSMIAVAFATLAFGNAATAQSYPTKSIRLIVPFPAGGGVDAVARVCAQKLSEILGEQVVIDNRAGSGGIIAAEFAHYIRAELAKWGKVVRDSGASAG